MTRPPDAIMLFAAGFGTRMGALTKDRPKPLIEVAGHPLIDHALDLARGVEPSRIVANLHYLPDQLAAHLEPQGVALSREEPEILETGGGLRAALPLLGPGPVFTLNTDAIWAGPNPLQLLRQTWDPERMDALLMCIPVAQAVGRTGQGDFTADTEGRIQRGPGLIYGGAQVLRTEELLDFPEKAFSLNLLWDRMRTRNRLFALSYPGRWCDVGHPGGIRLAEDLLADV
ncbi:MAG: nucleotidyltransferase family protein [Ruegeria sp.]|uniref:nucleotidyltransferase family protein n=1 Tax=Ruegeria sp. TaxID=1879320 RepID=UPI00349E5F23